MANSPGACPERRYDVQGAFDCLSQLRMLYQAYLSAISGNTRAVVRFNDRWSEYAKPEAPALLQLYQTMYAQCPGAATSGLPDLNPNLRVKRGRPSGGIFRWPHL